MPSLHFHLVLVTAWLTVNTGHNSGIRPFDPSPFSLLGVVVAVEAVILSSFILMRQNRMLRRGERRENLNLQIDLLAEKKITTLLQTVRAICRHVKSPHKWAKEEQFTLIVVIVSD